MGRSRPRSLHGAGLAQSSQAHPPAPTPAEASTRGYPGQISQETKSAGPPSLTSVSQRTRRRMQQRTAGCRPHGARVQPASQELRARHPVRRPAGRTFTTTRGALLRFWGGKWWPPQTRCDSGLWLEFGTWGQDLWIPGGCSFPAGAGPRPVTAEGHQLRGSCSTAVLKPTDTALGAAAHSDVTLSCGPSLQSARGRPLSHSPVVPSAAEVCPLPSSRPSPGAQAHKLGFHREPPPHPPLSLQ